MFKWFWTIFSLGAPDQWMTFPWEKLECMGEFHSNIKLKTKLIPYWISAVPTKNKTTWNMVWNIFDIQKKIFA